MIVLTNRENVVVAIGAALIDHGDQGVQVDNVIYTEPALKRHAVADGSQPNGAAPIVYCYTPEAGFYRNSNYRPSFNAEAEIERIKGVLDELLLGGVI